MCVCVFVCAEGTPVQAAGRRAHTPKKEERRESVCERRKRETAGQMNQPTNQPSEATSVCVRQREEDMRKKKEKRERESC